MRGPILAICLALMWACYSPPQPDCGFLCRNSGECPSNYFCAPDGICHREGSSPSTPCAIDARPDSPRPIDAPPDLVPPFVSATLPQADATNVATSEVVRVEFSEPVGGVDELSFQIYANAVSLPGSVNANDARNWVFIPVSLLPPSTVIEVRLTSAITDYSGNPLTDYLFQFTTGT